MIRILFVAALAVSHYAQALEVDASRAILIEGPIGNNLKGVTDAINNYAKQSKKPIDIILDSPGGAVVHGFLFINHMDKLKAEGIKFRCFVPGFAASMAFQILLQCNERYVLDRSFLLWHRVRINFGGMFGAPLTAPDALYFARELQKLDTFILKELYAELPGMSKSSIRYHFERETLHMGKDLAGLTRSIKSRKYIKGLFEAMSSSTTPKTSSGIFGGKGPIFIYQTDKVGTK